MRVDSNVVLLALLGDLDPLVNVVDDEDDVRLGAVLGQGAGDLAGVEVGRGKSGFLGRHRGAWAEGRMLCLSLDNEQINIL